MKQTIFNRTDLFLFLTRAGVLFQDIIQLTYDYTRQQTRQDGQNLIDPATGARANFTVYNDYKTVCDGLPMVYSNLHMGMSISSCVFSYTTNQMFFFTSALVFRLPFWKICVFFLLAHISMSVSGFSKSHATYKLPYVIDLWYAVVLNSNIW